MSVDKQEVAIDVGRVEERVKIREAEIEDSLMSEYIKTTIDRVQLYTGLTVVPSEFESIVVEIVMAMHRRKYHEGIEQESVDVFSVRFINNLLKQYEREFENYKALLRHQDDNDTTGKVVFR